MLIQTDASLNKRSSFQLKAKAARLVTTRDASSLAQAMDHYDNENLLILGGGSNSIFLSDVPGTVLCHQQTGMEILGADHESIRLRVGAGEPWHRLVVRSVQAGWHGLENLALIPGLTGAAPIQNIGAYGVELSDHLSAVEVYDRLHKRRKTLAASACSLGYRDSLFKHQPGRYVILTLTLRLLKRFQARITYGDLASRVSESPSAMEVMQAVIDTRRDKLPDPSRRPNCGSFFKNPVLPEAQGKTLLERFPDAPHWRINEQGCKFSAAWMIEQCGLRGHRIGDAGVSERHALILVNHGRASAEQLAQLIDVIRQRVSERFNTALEPEPQLYLRGRLIRAGSGLSRQLESPTW